MLKKIVAYKNIDGKENKKEVLLNLNTREISALNNKYEGNLEGFMTRLSEKKDIHGLVNVLDDIILTAYGEKSEDGEEFIKTPNIREKFSNSLAYAELFDEVVSYNEEQMTMFISAIVPSSGKVKTKK